MKIRMGFVSNSSSSSFVILGLKLDNNDDNIKKILDAFGDKTSKDDIWDQLYELSEVVVDDDILYVGNVLGDSSDGVEVEVDFTEAVDKAKKVVGKLGFTEKALKLLAGTRSC